MHSLIINYINNLREEDIVLFGKKNNINLSASEAQFIYVFIKNNYQEIMNNPKGFDFSKYKSHFSNDSYQKIETLIQKYIGYL